MNPFHKKIWGMNKSGKDFSLPDLEQAFPLSRKSFQWQKRMLDIIVSLILIVFVLTWLIPILAVLTLLDSGYPVFFLQKRVGYSNKMFCCFKLRTMTDSPVFDEKKISKLGLILRYLKLDETPQFINVLKGEMSLVGPRPHTLNDHIAFKRVIGPKYEHRHYVKPGITGLAQINGYEGPIDSQEKLVGRVKYDLEYIKIWTIWMDFRILWQTIICVLKLLFTKVNQSNS